MDPIHCSVLIVEDSSADRYLIKRLLKKANVQGEIFEAVHGQEALDFLKAKDENQTKYPNDFPPTAIMLDINMPIMDGFTFLERFNALRKERQELETVVFAMLTSSERKDDIEKAKAYDCVKNYVTKKELSAELMHTLLSDLVQDSP